MPHLLLVRLLTGVFLLISASTVWAHEVRPAIGDLTTADGRLELALSLNAEALVAGVDLDGVTDTDETDSSDRVDALRALSPEEMAERLRAALADVVTALDLRAGDAALTAQIDSIDVAPVGNTDLPRDTTIVLSADLPPAVDTVQMSWPAEYGTLVLRQQGVEDPYTEYLSGGQGSGPISVSGGDQRGALATFAAYVPVGFDHILPLGLDHILFVLGLFFLSPRIQPLLWQISAFTLAHTVTLALGATGVVSVSPAIVEPLIAASIAYVAFENIRSPVMSRWRPLVIFGFGLLHGLGFASVLGEFGLPQDRFLSALIGFNIGVELGQLTVIAAMLALVWVALRVDEGRAKVEAGQTVYGVLIVLFLGAGFLVDRGAMAAVLEVDPIVFLAPLAVLSALCLASVTLVDELAAYRRFVEVPASAVIGLVGVYWVIERVFL
ncbi:HupE/UreJ family protein [Primorskyibacter flagellatus]|uniref:HupE / UreJ protein n=1 Tax=Primorskyibacter flagellatus TaxID=1387277 RepID=A0A1W1Z419_9RHOB|nr:HupE/UreJ family protein [Primorskyibacter flagellatus]SMC43042.1 HupE / UreJ protein [Primorskyibacter flagellatus]